MDIQAVYLHNKGADKEGFYASIRIEGVPAHLSGKALLCHGAVPEFPNRFPLILTGELEGNTFKADSFAFEKDITRISRFLIKSKTCTELDAKKLFSVYTGQSFWDIRMEDEDYLKNLKISTNHRKSVCAMVCSVRYILENTASLKGYGFTPENMNEFFLRHLDLQDLKGHPYDTGYRCSVDLKTCDRIAQKENETLPIVSRFYPNSQERIKYVIRKSAAAIAALGNTYVSLPELERTLERFGKRGEIDKPDTDLMVIQALQSPIFSVNKNGKIFLSRYLQMEDEAAENLRRLLAVSLDPIPCKKKDIKKYDEGQKEAITGCLKSAPVNIITGGPGTGKTTTMKAVVKILEKAGLSVRLCAPTGRAAARLKESTGKAASTIHRLLGIKQVFTDEYIALYDRENPLTCDVIIIDEASMLSLDIFVVLLRAIPQGCRIIFTGDNDQLPSITPGNILRDLMDCGQIPVFRLTEVHRQEDGSAITDNAYRILEGNTPEAGTDFALIQCDNDEDAAKKAVELFQAEYSPEDPFSLQILCPVKNGDAGAKAINKIILDHDKARTPVRGNLAPGDKVMAVRNNYESIFSYINGDIGIVKDVEEHMLTISGMQGNTIYVQNIQDLQHAYACTVHKSQGSEYRHVVIVLGTYGQNMLFRNLLYTAVTRAREKVTIIYVGDMLAFAAKNRMGVRHSSLAGKLKVMLKRES